MAAAPHPRLARLTSGSWPPLPLKAEEERLRDALSVEDILESVVNAVAIKKTIRSRSPHRGHAREKLYVIESPNFTGIWIYTKGTIRKKSGREVFYVFISSKLAE